MKERRRDDYDRECEWKRNLRNKWSGDRELKYCRKEDVKNNYGGKWEGEGWE